MKCLLDTDILVYEAAFAGEYLDEESGERVPKAFDSVKEVFEQRVKEIEDECWATEPSLFFLTGDERLLKHVNKRRRRDGEQPVQFVPNFRYEIAKSKPYKARKSNKPYHYHNLRAWVLQEYEAIIAWGMEADDLLAVYQTERLDKLDTIICSRDKDLRQVPGMQYSWECGLQPSWGPTRVDEIGYLELPKPSKVTGCGMKFFYAQLITGDSVDTIPGLPRGGPALAYKTLSECETEEEMYERVAALYQEKIGRGWENFLREQANLLYMVRRIDDRGSPVLYQPPGQRGLCNVQGEASV